MRGPGLSTYVLGYVVAEVALLVWFWSAFGTVATVAVLLTGFLVGLLVMRIAGLKAFSVLTNAQRRAAAFGVTGPDGPTEMVHGPVNQSDVERTGREIGSSALLFVAGLLLASPGFISDAAGLIMLIPSVRRRIAARMSKGMRRSRPDDHRRQRRPVSALPNLDTQRWPEQRRSSGDPGRDPSAPARRTMTESCRGNYTLLPS